MVNLLLYGSWYGSMASLILPHTSLTATLDSMINCCSYWLHVNRIDLEVGYFLSLYSGHPIYWPLRLRLVRAIGTRISMRSPCSQRLPWLWCEQWRAPNSPTQLPHITDIPEARYYCLLKMKPSESVVAVPMECFIRVIYSGRTEALFSRWRFTSN